VIIVFFQVRSQRNMMRLAAQARMARQARDDDEAGG
jgi:hypothetical protein